MKMVDETLFIAFNTRTGEYLNTPHDVGSAEIYRDKATLENQLYAYIDEADIMNWVIWELNHSWTHYPERMIVWG